MTGPEKLRQWREEAVLSSWELEKELLKRMEPDFPNGFGKGERIFQSDIIEAEKGISGFKFKKVTTAISKYFGLPEDYFGKFVKANKHEHLSVVLEERSAFMAKSIELSDKLIKAGEENQKLRDELSRYRQRVHELEMENERLKGIRGGV